MLDAAGVHCLWEGGAQVPYYLASNPALPRMDDRRMWEHFVIEGQFEARPFRFRCPAGAGGAGAKGSGHAAHITPDGLVQSALEAAQGLMVGSHTWPPFLQTHKLQHLSLCTHALHAHSYVIIVCACLLLSTRICDRRKLAT